MKTYLVCDLDNCLLKTDLLYEQWFVLLKLNPIAAFISLLWIFKGRSSFKSRVATLAPLNFSSLPFRSDVVEYLKRHKSEHTKLILASASPFSWVQQIANNLGFFDHVIGSSEQANLKGSKKLAAIRELIGSSTFTYIGDHYVDLQIWQYADKVVAINPSTSLQSNIKQLNKPTELLFDKKPSFFQLLAKQLRPHQWIKNTLVFLPALAGHKVFSWETLINGTYAFAGFSLAASFVYILNDLLDLKSDRNHHSKKHRPFASGNLSIKWGIFLLPALLIGVGLLGSLLPSEFILWILAYLILNLAYSLYLKQSVVVDIILLSMMYTLRIFAGSAATSVSVSEWLLSFSTLFFFSLACVKRYTEILRSKNKITLDGRGYRQVDGGMIQSLGVGSGLISILIILLYLQSAGVRSLYNNPQNLWFATPILLFWISRIWILTNRDEIHDDPVVFAVKDKISWVCLVLLAIVFGVAT